MMLQQDAPEDFVLATGETHPVREFVEKSFGILGIQIRYGFPYDISSLQNNDNVFRSWQGTGVQEEGIDVQSGKTVVKVDPGYFRPAEVECVLPQQTALYRTNGYLKVTLGQPRQGRASSRVEAQGRLRLPRQGNG